MATAMAMAFTISVVAVVGVWGVTGDQSDCNSVLVTLLPCLDYVTGNSSTPSSACCTQLASVVSTQPKCLCEVVHGDAPSIGQAINETLALTLPSACKLQTPPVSHCSNASPMPSPTARTPDSSSGGGSNSNTESSTSRGSGSGGASSRGSFVKLLSSLPVFFLFVVSLTFALTEI